MQAAAAALVVSQSESGTARQRGGSLDVDFSNCPGNVVYSGLEPRRVLQPAPVRA